MMARHPGYAFVLPWVVALAAQGTAQTHPSAPSLANGRGAAGRAQSVPARPTLPGRLGRPMQRVELEIAGGGEPWGKIVVELDQEKAPLTVRNFLRYVDEGFYNGTLFHRVIPGYVIQGGGYETLGEPKAAGLREPLTSESRNHLANQRGTLAMARGTDPHSAKAQFFINVADNPKLDFPSRDGWGYCVFGRVVEGMEVVERVAAVPTGPNQLVPGENSQPIDPPVIKRAQRLPPEPPGTRPASAPRDHHIGGAPEPALAPARADPPPPPAEPPPPPETEESRD